MWEQGIVPIVLQGGVTMGILLLFSIYSLGVIAERFVAYRNTRRRSAGVAPQVLRYVREGKIAEAVAACEMTEGSHVAGVLLAGLREVAPLASTNPGVHDKAALAKLIEPARGAMQRRASEEIGRLERYLGSLATLGNISPFVGLFGTVLGIIRAFEAIAKTGSGGLGTVSAGIAEALVATAAGLFVAIPAVMAYNAFVGRVKVFTTEMDNAASELADQLQRLAA